MSQEILDRSDVDLRQQSDDTSVETPDNGEIAAVSVAAVTYKGPLPPPAILQGYKEINPAYADMIMQDGATDGILAQPCITLYCSAIRLAREHYLCRAFRRNFHRLVARRIFEEKSATIDKGGCCTKTKICLRTTAPFCALFSVKNKNLGTFWAQEILNLFFEAVKFAVMWWQRRGTGYSISCTPS